MLLQRLKLLFFFAVLSWVYSTVAFGQAKEDGEVLEKDIPLSVREVAPGLFFQYHHAESNNAWLVTHEGVLVIDTRQHPERAKELLAEIRKTTDQPIKWVINTHFHGDHYFGNRVFKEVGAQFIAHVDTAVMMKTYFDEEMKRRMGYFKQRGYMPQAVKLVMPDITFEGSLHLTLGGQAVDVLYLGAGQNPGDAIVYFPKQKVIFAGGPVAKDSWTNPSFTPSIPNWVDLLKTIQAMDAQIYLGGHGDVASKEDLQREIELLDYFDAGMREAESKNLSVGEIIQQYKFERFKDFRNYYRLNIFIKNYDYTLRRGHPEVFLPSNP
jgi:glyoxylase-like metal-dependent hydrolase (beta-lactamase superfamily II)